QGESADDTHTSSGKLLPVDRNIFAINPGTLLGCDIESKNGTLDFSARRLDRLARFLGHGAGELFFTFSDTLGYTAQNTLALEGGQSASGTEGLYDGGYRGSGVVAHSSTYIGDSCA